MTFGNCLRGAACRVGLPAAQLKWLGIIAAIAVLPLGSPAAAAVWTQTWNLSASSDAFGMIDFHLPRTTGPTHLTVRSSREFFGAPSVWAYEEEHFHEIPIDGGPVFGYRVNRNSQTALRSGTHGFTVDYTTTEDSHEEGCCAPGIGWEMVPYVREYHYTPMIFIDFSFAPGDDPITVTMSVAAVPEPASWAMMIIGFGAVGSMVRGNRRRLLQAV